MKRDGITFSTANAMSVKELITWLASQGKTVNVTIVIQSIGNIVNSTLENVNVNA